MKGLSDPVQQSALDLQTALQFLVAQTSTQLGKVSAQLKGINDGIDGIIKSLPTGADGSSQNISSVASTLDGVKGAYTS